MLKQVCFFYCQLSLDRCSTITEQWIFSSLSQSSSDSKLSLRLRLSNQWEKQVLQIILSNRNLLEQEEMDSLVQLHIGITWLLTLNWLSFGRGSIEIVTSKKNVLLTELNLEFWQWMFGISLLENGAYHSASLTYSKLSNKIEFTESTLKIKSKRQQKF